MAGYLYRQTPGADEINHITVIQETLRSSDVRLGAKWELNPSILPKQATSYY